MNEPIYVLIDFEKLVSHANKNLAHLQGKSLVSTLNSCRAWDIDNYTVKKIIVNSYTWVDDADESTWVAMS